MKNKDQSAFDNCNVWIHGISGRMGREISFVLTNGITKMNLQGGSSSSKGIPAFTDPSWSSSLILDFSSPKANEVLRNLVVDAVGDRKLGILIGTTGLEDREVESWKILCEKNKKWLSVLFAPNTSLGVMLIGKALAKIASYASDLGFDISIEETHHKNKKDSPSGTALSLARCIVDNSAFKLTDIGMLSTRGGGNPGEHSAKLLGEHEEVTLSHRAYSRRLFALGAVRMGQWLQMQQPGFYTVNDIDL